MQVRLRMICMRSRTRERERAKRYVCSRGSAADDGDLLRVAIYDDANLTRPACSYDASRLRVTPRHGRLWSAIGMGDWSAE